MPQLRCPSGELTPLCLALKHDLTAPAHPNIAPALMTLPTTTRDTPDVPQRFLLSCVVCHRRKIKCDRYVKGCGNCTKARIVCIYPKAKVALQRSRARPSLQPKEHAKREREMERKLKALEAKVHALTNATIRSHISTKSSSPTVEGGPVGELKPNVGAVRRDGKVSVRPLAVGQLAIGDTMQSVTAQQIASNRTVTDRFWDNFYRRRKQTSTTPTPPPFYSFTALRA
jgi:hypothetical protein